MQHALTRTTIRFIQHLVVWAVQAFLLVSVAGWFQTIEVEAYDVALVGIVTVSAINAFVMPPLIQLAIRVRALLFPIVSFAINAGVILLTDYALPGWDIHGLLPAAMLALALAGMSTFLGSLLAISDDAAWRRFVLAPTHARMRREPRVQTDVPGHVFLEIDGLSTPVLREAIRKGYAPNLERWLESGSHELVSWEPDLSSQTSASQAGILLGSNENIPAFRWYNREIRRVMVSNTVRDSAAIEERLSTGNGLLADGGASRGNLFSGDAPDNLLTFSTIRKPKSTPNRHYALFYANPYNVGRTIALYFADVVREYAAGIWQLIRNDRPRVPRFGVYPWLRAATTSILRELTTFAVAGDLMRGVPSIYATYVAYDEVAHHSGILRADALRVLRDIDRDIGRLEQVAVTAPRPYHLVVLSDHGQSQGATFRQRWGRSLRQVVEDAVARSEGRDEAGAVAGDLEVDEGWQSISALLTDLLALDDRRAGIVKAALRNRIRDGEVQIGPGATQPRWRRQRREPLPPDYDDGKVLVLASGSLGLISMTGWSERLTLEQIEAHYPALITTLLEHEGIGWIMVRSQEQGSVVLGPEGAVVVETGQVVGKDPLAPYGPRALRHVRRTDGYRDVPDVLVHSAYNPDTGELPAFEELVGSHGGLGGYQTEPFLLYPGTLCPGEEPIVGAEEVHLRLKAWIHAAGTKINRDMHVPG